MAELDDVNLEQLETCLQVAKGAKLIKAWLGRIERARSDEKVESEITMTMTCSYKSVGDAIFEEPTELTLTVPALSIVATAFTDALDKHGRELEKQAFKGLKSTIEDTPG